MVFKCSMQHAVLQVGTNYGVVRAPYNSCNYTDPQHQLIISSTSFDILVGTKTRTGSRSRTILLQVGDQSRVGLKWLGSPSSLTSGAMKKGGALPCHLNIRQDSDCYFGQGVYSDGICDEVQTTLAVDATYCNPRSLE